MTDELDQLLRSLRLNRTREIFDEQLKHAEKADLSYTEFVLRLLRPQWHARQEQALNWRIKKAALPEPWTLESFPYAKQPGVNRKHIRAFAELDFVAKAENIVFIGPTGVGKTGLAIGILLKALQNGYRGLFIRAQDLFDEMYASLADRSSRKLINRLARLDVLLIDELGYLNVKPEQANIFFKLMGERYRHKATLITTNLDYQEWGHFLGNPLMTDALLGRIRHQCITVHIKGPSLRDPGPRA
jgi:DNA replication protein DnaC